MQDFFWWNQIYTQWGLNRLAQGHGTSTLTIEPLVIFPYMYMHMAKKNSCASHHRRLSHYLAFLLVGQGCSLALNFDHQSQHFNIFLHWANRAIVCWPGRQSRAMVFLVSTNKVKWNMGQFACMQIGTVLITSAKLTQVANNHYGTNNQYGVNNQQGNNNYYGVNNKYGTNNHYGMSNW